MDTTNRKAGSATLAACALFLPCVASAGCRGVGTDGAAGRTEASGPASTIRGESAPATRSATDLPGGGEGSRRAGTRRGRERRTGSRANRRFPAKCQAPRRGPSSEPRSGRGHPAAKARTRPSPRSRARGRSVRPSASPRKRLDAPRKCSRPIRRSETASRRIGGMATSTLLTLLVVPVICDLVDRGVDKVTAWSRVAWEWMVNLSRRPAAQPAHVARPRRRRRRRRRRKRR